MEGAKGSRIQVKTDAKEVEKRDGRDIKIPQATKKNLKNEPLNP